MMFKFGRFALRGRRCTSTNNVSAAATSIVSRYDSTSAIMYARQRCIIRRVYPNGFHCNIGSNNKLIVPPFNRCAFSTRRDNIDMRQCNTIEELVQLAHDHLDTISLRDIAAFWSSLAKLVQNHRGGNSRAQLNEQLAEILYNTMESMYKFDGRDIATVAISLAKIMKQVEFHGQRADTGSLHRILHNLLVGINFDNKHYIFSEIAVHAIPILSKFEARHLSNLIYSFGFAEYVPKVEGGRTILDVLALEAMSKLNHFNPQGLSNMLWSYTKLESSNSLLFKAAGDSIVGMNDLSEFWPQALSNIIWSYATAGESHPPLFSKFGDHIVGMKDLGLFKPQELSNIIWSYATAGESHPKLFKKIADHIVAMKDLGQFMPQHLSNIVWSYATAGESHPQLFRKFADHIVAMKDLGQFLPQHLSNIVMSYAKAGEAHPRLFRKFADHIVAMRDLGHFKPQDFSNIIWAYATAGESHPKLFKIFGDHIVAMKDLGQFKPQDFSNIIWAYATAGELHPLIFQKLAVVGIERCNDFNSQDIANFLWAYATVGIIDSHLFTSFAPAVKSVLGQCSSQALANVAWAYAVANVNDPLLFNTDFINALQANVDRFVREDLFQLHQWQLWQDELKSDIILPPALRDKCRQAFDLGLPQPSRLQDDVVSVLSSIGMLPEEEVLTSSGYRLDALVKVNGEKVGIEVDGPSHFMNRAATGSTLLKRRQVNKLDGIRIVSVPYWDWDNFAMKDQTKKQKYLRSKLGLRPV